MTALKEFAAILITVFVAALFVRMLITVFLDLKKRRSSPVTGVSATVIKKEKLLGASAFEKSGVRSGKSVYTAAFSTENGELSFDISEKDYELLEEGSTGLLNFKGKIFLDFTPDRLSGGEREE